MADRVGGGSPHASQGQAAKIVYECPHCGGGIQSAAATARPDPGLEQDVQALKDECEWFTNAAEKWEKVARELYEALKIAADDLDKAANQFEGLRLGGGPVVNNMDIFEAKAVRARDVLSAHRRASGESQ